MKPTPDWRSRLDAARIAKGRSMRDVSLAAGAGAGYLHSILKEGKDPGIERLSAICDQIGVSLPYILYGINITPEDEKIVAAAQRSPQLRAAVLALLRDQDANQQ